MIGFSLSLGARLVGGYLLGSIPSGYLIARWCGIDDIRDHGSGSTGATNVARILGIKYFFIVFCLDFLKSYSYITFLVHHDVSHTDLVGVSIALLIGNGYSLFFGRRSGKGVATLCGILCALAPLFLGTLLCGWLIILLVSQTIGIASMVIYACMPWCSYFFYDGVLLPFLIFASLWGLWLHRNNISLYARTMFT